MADTINPDAALVASWLPLRDPDTHKRRQGHVLVAAGSPGMHGAAVFAAAAAYRAGAGLVTAVIPREIYGLVGAAVPEALFVFRSEHDAELSGVSGVHALLVGPGLPRTAHTRSLVRKVTAARVPQVWDAGALDAAAEAGGVLPEDTVVTPHMGEMARLCGESERSLRQARRESAQRFADKSGAVTVLKGRATVIAVPRGKAAYVNVTGSPALATAGTGDCLAGIIASLLAQGLTPERAAVCGVYWHGFAGQMMREGQTASDLLALLPQAREEILRQAGNGRMS
ncbi:MAG: NAD(P)H-hydrate dehydratase [Oscillospiraceae bacterium]|jgi:NAD(P)H-hydrate epimerase|nr:NAD(P)H-hydrate dehydratase [Oscillospiraceae bacterium]